MAFDVAQFREDFPDFASTTTYPDSMLSYWGDLSQVLHSKTVFTDVYDNITSLYVAHKSILQAKNIAESANGVPNQFAGAITGATIGNVTVDFSAAQASMFKSMGDFTETVYGRQYLDLMNMYCNTGIVY